MIKERERERENESVFDRLSVCHTNHVRTLFIKIDLNYFLVDFLNYYQYTLN